MWRFELLILLYAFAGLAVWTWVIRNHPPRTKQQARGMKSLRRRRRLVEGIGVGSITIVAVLAAVVGFVDASGVALALAVLVGCAKLLLVLAFNRRRRLGTPALDH